MLSGPCAARRPPVERLPPGAPQPLAEPPRGAAAPGARRRGVVTPPHVARLRCVTPPHVARLLCVTPPASCAAHRVLIAQPADAFLARFSLYMFVSARRRRCVGSPP